jgi:hypothetical protein
LIIMLGMVPPVVSDDAQGSLKPRHTNYILTDYKDKLNTQMRLKVLKALARRRIATTHNRQLLSTEDPDLMVEPVSKETNLTGMEHPSTIDAYMEFASYPDADMDLNSDLDTYMKHIIGQPGGDNETGVGSGRRPLEENTNAANNETGVGAGRRLLTATTASTLNMTTTPNPDKGHFTTGGLVALIGGIALAVLGIAGGFMYYNKHHMTTNNGTNKTPMSKSTPTSQDKNEFTQPLVKKTALNVQGFLEFPTRV